MSGEVVVPPRIMQRIVDTLNAQPSSPRVLSVHITTSVQEVRVEYGGATGVIEAQRFPL